MEHPISQAYFYFDTADANGATALADVQSFVYCTKPLAKLDRHEAVALCEKLYGPEERFAQGFYRYYVEILHMSEKDSWDATMEELNDYIQKTTGNLDDPYMHTVGFEHQGTYVPVGIFGLRSLSLHETGVKLIETIESRGLQDEFPGNLSIAHSFSALNGYRNRALMKFVFLMIALQAIEEDFQHIFFFMSDYRLGPIYERYGLEFPPNLRFNDSQHLVGCYRMTPEHLQEVKRASAKYGHHVLERAESLIRV